MGIFQLIDYVGVDVFSLILAVMERHLAEGLVSPFVDRLLAQGVKGGQTSSGAQRDGILRYENGTPYGGLRSGEGVVPLRSKQRGARRWGHTPIPRSPGRPSRDDSRRDDAPAELLRGACQLGGARR